MKFKVHTMDKGGKRQDVDLEASSVGEAFDKIKGQGLFPVSILETIDDNGNVSRGLRPWESSTTSHISSNPFTLVPLFMLIDL